MRTATRMASLLSGPRLVVCLPAFSRTLVITSPSLTSMVRLDAEGSVGCAVHAVLLQLLHIHQHYTFHSQPHAAIMA